MHLQVGAKWDLNGLHCCCDDISCAILGHFLGQLLAWSGWGVIMWLSVLFVESSGLAAECICWRQSTDKNFMVPVGGAVLSAPAGVGLQVD